MISDERADAAVEFIRDHAKRHGQLKGAISFHEYETKRAKAAAFLESEGTVAEREHKAMLDDSVRQAHEKLRDSIADEMMLRDQIEAATLTFEKWRTEQSNARAKGMP